MESPMTSQQPDGSEWETMQEVKWVAIKYTLKI